MIPLAKKLETFHPKVEGMDQSVHGHDGPINVSDGGYRGTSENSFMETVKQMGYKSFVDLQDFDSNDGFSVSVTLTYRSAI